MRKLITICVVTVPMFFVFTVSDVEASINTFAGRSVWEDAVNHNFEEEFFTDATLNPGISVVTNNGYVDVSGAEGYGAGVWWDRVIPASDPAGPATTTWTFADPIVGYGGNWNLAGPGGPGTNIQLYLDGMPVGSEIMNTYAGEFFGVVSTLAFNQVVVTAGSNPGGWCETYTLDNMVYTPEPCTLSLLAFGGLALLRKRRA
ncbi:MAG: hypothetical protein ABII09_10485 [Planctomycetota bacterium]